MSWRIICDLCDKRSESRHPVGWLRVEEETPPKENEEQFDHDNPEFDFCSAACLQDWALCHRKEAVK